MLLKSDTGLSVQRGHIIAGAVLGACLLLAGCGQPLVGIPAGNSAAQTVGSATPGVPSSIGAGGQAPTPGPAGAAELGGVPEASGAPAENQGAPPVENASAPPVEGAGAPPAADNTAGAPAAESPAAAMPAPEPTINPAFGDVKLPGAEERWRYVQQDRTPLDSIQTYTTPSREILWWYDPLLGRTIKLGEIQGDFPVQATFRFRGQEVDALEVPYQINSSFGITLPTATVDAIRKAGYSGEWIEAFVYKTEDIRPK